MKKNMSAKKIMLIFTSICLISATSCNTQKDNNKNTNKAFNNLSEIRMDNSAIYNYDGSAYVIDYESMESSTLCNIPNCTHSSADCIVNICKINNELPIVYNSSAYYFVNSDSFAEKNGKSVLDLKTDIKKYDFNNNKISHVTTIDGFNMDISSGGYLIGSDYYFINTYGNPRYDDAGNVTMTTNGGGGNLFSINLETGKVTDYGEVFDYEKLKETYPASANSTSIQITGKIDNNLFMNIHYQKEECTIEMMQNGDVPPFSGETYTFNLDTHKYEKYDDYFSTCSMNGYHTYFTDEDNTKLEIKNIKTGEITKGPEITGFNTISVIDDKIWHDSTCFDIKTGNEIEIPSKLPPKTAIGEYKDYYIVQVESNDQNMFEKILKSKFNS
ncbi:MAG: hypothetical protein HFK00_02035 [Oscillospiraceae bacterium]|nr:hypothetical protein [Oscillospiraceae bacterium]